MQTTDRSSHPTLKANKEHLYYLSISIKVKFTLVDGRFKLLTPEHDYEAEAQYFSFYFRMFTARYIKQTIVSPITQGFFLLSRCLNDKKALSFIKMKNREQKTSYACQICMFRCKDYKEIKAKDLHFLLHLTSMFQHTANTSLLDLFFQLFWKPYPICNVCLSTQITAFEVVATSCGHTIMTIGLPQTFAFFQTFNQTNTTKVCPGSQCLFAFYGGETIYHRYIIVLHLYNLFVFLWLVEFTIALGQCTLAGAFASYYWALNKPNDIPACPLFSSFCRAIR